MGTTGYKCITQRVGRARSTEAETMNRCLFPSSLEITQISFLRVSFSPFFFFFKLLWGATPEWRRTKYIVCLSKTISLVSFKVSNLIRAQQTEPGPDESAVLHNHRLPCSIQSSHIHLQYTVYHLCDAPHLLNILSLKIWTAVHAFDIQMHASHVLYILWSKSKMRFFFPFFALH